jgi:hypothetical protein
MIGAMNAEREERIVAVPRAISKNPRYIDVNLSYLVWILLKILN